METVSSVVTCRNGVTKNKLRQHNVTMIGDSFLRGFRENVELSLNNKFVLGSLTHKDVILIFGGSNDFNFDKDETIIIISWNLF